MVDLDKYRIRCTTQNDWVYQWAETEPTKCPVDTAHTIDATKTAIVDSRSASVVLDKPVIHEAPVKLAAFGFQFTATKASTTTYDHKITEAVRLRGGYVETDKQAFGDSVTIEIVDVDDVLGYGPGTVLANYFTGWNCRSSGYNEITEGSVGDVVAKDLYIRVKYTSTGAVDDVTVLCNFRAYKDK